MVSAFAAIAASARTQSPSACASLQTDTEGEGGCGSVQILPLLGKQIVFDDNSTCLLGENVTPVLLLIYLIITEVKHFWICLSVLFLPCCCHG